MITFLHNLTHTTEQIESYGPNRWFQFEKDVAGWLSKSGYEVEHRAASKNGDDGVDLYAVDSKGNSYLVQAKCWSNPVGVAVIREMLGTLTDIGENSKGLVVTTSSFTSGATEFAANHGIELIEFPV